MGHYEYLEADANSACYNLLFQKHNHVFLKIYVLTLSHPGHINTCKTFSPKEMIVHDEYNQKPMEQREGRSGKYSNPMMN